MQGTLLDKNDGLKTRGVTALRALLLGLLLTTAMNTPSFAQEAEDDGDGPIRTFGVDRSGENSDEDEEETPFAQQLRTEPIGGVNEGLRIGEDDPYAAEGIRLGNFIFRPSLEIGLSASRDRANIQSGTPAGIVSETSTSVSNQNALRLLVNSDWSRHELEIEATSTLPFALSGDATSPTYGALGSLRLDLSSTTTLTLGAEYSLSNEDPQSSAFQVATDPLLNPGITGANEPATRLVAGNASLAHDFGGLTTQITAAIGRLQYGQARLSDGTSVTQSDLNSTDFDLTLRGGYALSGVLSPFVEAGYGMRVMDEALDAAGVDRNSTRYALRLGTTIDMGEKFNGEVSVGYAAEKLDDTRFDTVHAIALAASLNWSPMRNTDVSFDVTTDIQPSGLDDVAASTVYATELGLSHRLRRNLTLNAALSAGFESYAGPQASETSLGAEIGLTYNLNRFMALTGRVSNQQILSPDVLQRDNRTSAFVGLRLQR